MKDFIDTLLDPNVFFLRYALIAGILSGIAVGIVGSFAVARRITYVAGAISHSLLGGIGLALFCQSVLKMGWFDPRFGAALAGFLSAAFLVWMGSQHKEREDTAISAVWATGMGVGLLFIAKTPGFTDPMSYLFGDILLISRFDLWLLAALDIVVLITTSLFFHQLVAVCFDEEFAKIRGIPVWRFHLLLLSLATLTVVILVTMVGIVLVIALLALPTAIANRFSRRMIHTIFISCFLSIFFATAGLLISFLANVPTGPVIILLATFCYFAAFFHTSRIKSAERTQ